MDHEFVSEPLLCLAQSGKYVLQTWGNGLITLKRVITLTAVMTFGMIRY